MLSAGTSSLQLFGIVLLCLLSCGRLDAEVRVLDDSGRTVVLDHPAGRIVSLAPHITELLFAIGAGEAVTAASEYSDYPLAAQSIPRVAGGSGVDIEALLVQRPELVVAWGSGTSSGQIQRLRQLGIPVFVSEPRVMGDIVSTLERLGRLTGHREVAAGAIQAFNERHRVLRQRYAGSPPVRIFYQIWQQPLMTVNGDHLVSDVIRLCGGSNIFADLPELAPSVSLESVLRRDPEVIVAAADGEGTAALTDQWRRWTGLSAVQGRHLYTIRRELLVRHTPRILDGAERLCEILESVRKASGRE